MNCSKLALFIGIITAGTQFAAAEDFDSHGLKRLIDRVIYIDNGEYRGSIPKIQSISKSGLKVAGAAKLASTTLNTIYGNDLNETASYYSQLLGDVYIMAIQSQIPIDGAAAHLYTQGHSLKTSKWAAQRMSLVRSTMNLLHGDLGMPAPVGMPAFPINVKQPFNAQEFSSFMVGVKAKAESSKSLTTEMAAALASSPSQLNGLVQKSSFLIKDKIASLLADPVGHNSAVPMAMRTNAQTFNSLNVGDLYLALGVIALHIHNPNALSDAGIKIPPTIRTAFDSSLDLFKTNDKKVELLLRNTKQGTPIWKNAPLGPVIL